MLLSVVCGIRQHLRIAALSMVGGDCGRFACTTIWSDVR